MNIEQRGSVRVEPGAKRVRAFVQGREVADTLRPLLVWEVPYYPTYYVPLEDVRAELVPNGEVNHSPSRGDGISYDVSVGEATVKGAAQRFPDSPIVELRNAVRLDFAAMDEWFEEDEPIYVHPRDPYKRGRHTGQLAPRGHRGRRPGRRRLPPTAHLVRDGAAAPVLPAPDRCPDGPPAPVADPDPVPLQGHGHLLVAAGGRQRTRGRWCGSTGPRWPRARR